MSYKRIQDLLDLALWMQSNDDGVSISDIMNRFQVSKRTAIRMKDMIKERFPQIKQHIGSHNFKRWYIPKGMLNSLVVFSLNEINALQNSIKLAKTRTPNDVDFLQNILFKIKSAMGKDVLNRIEPDAEVLLEAEGYVFHPGPKIQVEKEFVTKLKTAILACTQIKLKYDSMHNKDWRILEPYGFLYGNKHYLIAWEPEKGKMCHFNLNKIIDIEVTDKYFQRSSDFSLKDFSEQSFGVYQEEPFDVEWLFDKEVAAEAQKYIFHPKQTATANEDGTLTVKFRAGGAREMDWHLYTWGEHVKVIKPENFKELRQWKG